MNVFENRYFRFSKQLIQLVGQWPYERYRVKTIKRLLCVLCLWLSTPVLVLGIAKEWDMPFVALCRGLPPILTIIGATAKYNTYTVFEKEFKKVLSDIEFDWSEIRHERERDILETYVNKGRVLVLFYSKYVCVSALTMLIIPQRPCLMDYISPLNESRQRRTLFPATYGINMNDSLEYWIICCHMSIGTILLAWLMVACDSMYFLFIHHVCGMFAIAGHRMEHICRNEKLYESIEMKGQGLWADEGKASAIFWKCLMQNVRLHERSIRYATLLESCYTWTYFLAICLNMVTMSVTGVLAVVRFDVYDESAPAICFAAAQVLHLYFMSLPGQMLIDISGAVRDRVYDSNWYTLPPDCQRVFVLLMIRSFYPCQITAGKFFVCKLGTFGSVVQTSMSYLTVIASFQ